MPIETLFLDAGGVLVFPNWALVSDALARHGVAVDPRRLAEAEPFVKRDIDTATTVAATNDDRRGWLYFDLILRQLGIRPDAATAAALRDLSDYHQRVNLWEYVPADVKPCLKAFRELGLRMVVVSNANGRLAELFERVGLAVYFDYLLDSSKEGVEKPDPRLFRLALERAGARAETTLHVGDLYHVDVAGARAAGLHAVLLDPVGLYPDVDCPRVQSLAQVVEMLRAGVSGQLEPS